MPISSVAYSASSLGPFAMSIISSCCLSKCGRNKFGIALWYIGGYCFPLFAIAASLSDAVMRNVSSAITSVLSTDSSILANLDGWGDITVIGFN